MTIRNIGDICYSLKPVNILMLNQQMRILVSQSRKAHDFKSVCQFSAQIQRTSISKRNKTVSCLIVLEMCPIADKCIQYSKYPIKTIKSHQKIIHYASSDTTRFASHMRFAEDSDAARHLQKVLLKIDKRYYIAVTCIFR